MAFLVQVIKVITYQSYEFQYTEEEFTFGIGGGGNLISIVNLWQEICITRILLYFSVSVG